MEVNQTETLTTSHLTASNNQKPASVAQDLAGFFRTLKRLVQIGLSLLFVVAGVNQFSEYQGITLGTVLTKPTVVPQSSAKVSAAPANTAPEDLRIGGRTLRIQTSNSVTSYSVPDAGRSFTNQAQAVRYIREGNFQQYTGVRSSALIDYYMKADLDGNGKLSFAELESFQKTVYKKFKYQHNDSALRPDDFLSIGGGDCEDFALFTAGLLRFWGWEPYIGLYELPTGRWHAVCLSFEAGSFPAQYTYELVSDSKQPKYGRRKNGKYIPIDYDHIGKLTNAVPTGSVLVDILIPEAMWGLGY